VKLLKAFIHARRFTGSSPDRGWKWPNKNKPKVIGGDTLVQLAYECRTGQLKLKETTVEEVVVQEQVAAAPDPTVETLGNADDDGPPPSFFLLDRNWVEQVHVNCVGGSFVEMESVDDAMKTRADLLAKLIRQRLANHKSEKVDANKQSHFTLGWFSDNVSRVAAIAVLANHVRAEPDTIDGNACLLQYPTQGVDNKFLVIVNDLLKAEGCYLYYDKIEHEWRRSGKVSDRGFGDRHKDHWKNAKNSGSSTAAKQSKLYTEYPSKESNLVRLGGESGEKCWKGYFEDLVLYCGIGFDRSRTVSGLIETDEGKGIFSWDKTVIDCLAGSTKLGDTMSDRQLCMVAYLLELGYDLMISPKFNLSRMPGFEAAGLIPFEKDN
jgi:hypothetical protein